MYLSKVYINKNSYYCSDFETKSKKIKIWSTKKFLTKKECELEYTKRTWIKHTHESSLIRRHSKKFREKRYKF